jgi:hypothetical protein
MTDEFCIMPDNPPIWRNYRENYTLHRHEIFHGPNRKRSINDGMVIFLPPELHNMSSRGIHFNRVFEDSVKMLAERVWMEHYNKGIEDFIRAYGRNFLQEDYGSVDHYLYAARAVTL